MECLGGVTPEVERHVGVLHARLRISLLAVDKVGELHGVLDEKDGRVVANHVIVALFGVEFDGETARVTIAVIGAALTRHS